MLTALAGKLKQRAPVRSCQTGASGTASATTGIRLGD